jgi:hypothetical protein
MPAADQEVFPTPIHTADHRAGEELRQVARDWHAQSPIAHDCRTDALIDEVRCQTAARGLDFRKLGHSGRVMK